MAEKRKRSSVGNSVKDLLHVNSVSEKIYNYFKMQKYCDVTLVAGQDKQRVSAHRIVLHASSPYLEKLLTVRMIEATKEEITIQGVSGDSLRALLTFCYTGEILLNEDNVDDIVGAASLMAMTSVERLCEKYYLQRLSRTNCLGLWQLAEQYVYDELKTSALAIALEEFVLVVDEEEFVLLKPETLERLLKSDSLYVHSEESVFNALVRWINHDKERQTFFEELMKLVRMNRMKPSILQKRVMPFFRQLNSLYLFADLTAQNLDDSGGAAELAKAPRIWGQRPLPLIVGRSDSPTADHLIINQYSYLKRTWSPMIKLSGSCKEFALVQAHEYLFIIGGRDRSNVPLRTVRRVDLRTWQCSDAKSMVSPSAKLKCVHHNGVIYAFGVDNGSNAGFVHKYDVASDKWEIIRNTELKNVHMSSFDVGTSGNHIWLVYSNTEKTIISVFDPLLGALFHRNDITAPMDLISVNFDLCGLVINAIDKWTHQKRAIIYNEKKNTINLQPASILPSKHITFKNFSYDFSPSQETSKPMYNHLMFKCGQNLSEKVRIPIIQNFVVDSFFTQFIFILAEDC